ncbi:MAG: hypothetical protein JXR62_05135 [Bacilli bacterium]|nr:hypothetical protein [Bacilli bacterium]
MNDFETMWRQKIKKNTLHIAGESTHDLVQKNDLHDEVLYSKQLIRDLKNNILEDKIKDIFCKSACHISHDLLINAKKVYEDTRDIEAARKELLVVFEQNTKPYKQMTDEQYQACLSSGMGLAGLPSKNGIIVTKIPSRFQEYYLETDPKQKKSLYCHCPRIRHELLGKSDIDSIYCNCGGGFYQDIWEFITGKKVTIELMKSLFDGNDVCQFHISFK